MLLFGGQFPIFTNGETRSLEVKAQGRAGAELSLELRSVGYQEGAAPLGS